MAAPDGHDRHLKQIERLFVDGRSRSQWRALRKHLQACEKCRAHYDQLMLLERQLGGGQETLTEAQVERIEAEILGVLAERPDRRGWTTKRLLLVHGLALALALVVVFVLYPPGRVSDADFAPKGPGDQWQSSIGIRAFCMYRDSEGNPRIRTSIAQATTGGPVQRCNLSDLLQFTYSNLRKEGRPGAQYLFIFGLDRDHRPFWYHSHPESGQSAWIGNTIEVIDEPQAGSIQLWVNHRPGPVRIFGLFSQNPISIDEVRTCIAGLKAQGVPIEQVRQLPLERDDVLQTNLLLWIEE